MVLAALIVTATARHREEHSARVPRCRQGADQGASSYWFVAILVRNKTLLRISIRSSDQYLLMEEFTSGYDEYMLFFLEPDEYMFFLRT
jgi:hypothetical protein